MYGRLVFFGTLCGLGPHVGVEGQKWVVPLNILAAAFLYGVSSEQGRMKGALKFGMSGAAVTETHNAWSQWSGNGHLLIWLRLGAFTDVLAARNQV